VDQGTTTPAKSVANPADIATKSALEEIVVTSYKYLNIDTSGTTNFHCLSRRSAVHKLVSNDFIQAADLKTLAEIAEYTPGAVNVGAIAGFSSVIKLRGSTLVWRLME